MKKLLFIPILFAFALTGFIACNDNDGDAIYYIAEEPAIFGFSADMQIIKTPYGKYYAPGLGTNIEDGTHLWINWMMVNQDNPKVGDYYTAEDVRYTIINTSLAKETDGKLPGNEDTFTDSISSAILYNSYLDNFLYFRFEQQAPEGQEFEYEMYFMEDIEDSEETGSPLPCLYIKTKRVGTFAGSNVKIATRYGFDMTDFLKSELGNSPVKFNIRYKIGTKDGEDVYKPFEMNPISWKGMDNQRSEYS